MRKHIDLLATLGLTLVLAVLTASAWLADGNTQQLAQNDRWVKHTYEVLGNLDNLLLTVIDAETGQRGYLLAGKRRFLSPYQEANQRVGEQLRRLASDTADNPQQQERVPFLQAAIEAHLASLEQTLSRHAQTADAERQTGRL